VDLDDAMLAACRELGLEVHTGDAVKFLASLPDGSQSVVSGFHIAEHLPFDLLQKLVSEALRVLMPGGLLILETPNPENLVVGTSAFYLDPTHIKPIPPQLLEFLTEYAGFKRSKIIRLQESKNLASSDAISLLAVLDGVSPDYAVVAQKSGPDELFAALDGSFSAEYGLSLATLANRYQQQVEAIEAKAQQALAELQAIYASRSWRWTAPLRAMGRIVRQFRKSLSRFAFCCAMPRCMPTAARGCGGLSWLCSIASRHSKCACSASRWACP
jgi:O-antigen chain-terminating methyltransferase